MFGKPKIVQYYQKGIKQKQLNHASINLDTNFLKQIIKNYIQNVTKEQWALNSYL